MDSADRKDRRQKLERRVVEAFTTRPAFPFQPMDELDVASRQLLNRATLHKAGSALDKLDDLNREMAADAASIKSALTCSTPGHDFRICPDCQARLARIREVMRG